MNKPISQLHADPDIGPLDEHGQQIWSPEEESAIARMEAQPDFWAGVRLAEEQIVRGEWFSTEQVLTELEKRRRQRRDAI